MTTGDILQEDPRPSTQTDIYELFGKLIGPAEFKAQMRGFSLHLGDGSHWWIASSRQATFIAEKLATIMQLKEGDPGDGHLVFFYEKDADHRRLELHLSQAQGWLNLYRSYFQIRFHSRLRHVLCEYDSTKPSQFLYALMAFAFHSVHWGSICRGGLPFHAALLEHQGQGVILAAPGGTGKSTCSSRVVFPWQARCDDEVLVVLDPGGRYLAHPFPTWTDYFWERAENTWEVEDAVPVAGIFFLEQSPEDDFVPLEGAQAAVAATRSAEQVMALQFLRESNSGETRELKRTMFTNACEIVKQIPAFHLRVSRTGRFWEKIEAALGWR